MLALFCFMAGYGDASERLAAAAADTDQEAARRALAGIQRMGARAAAAVRPFQESLPNLPPPRQRLVLETLGYVGPSAAETLSEWLDHRDSETRLAAIQALKRIGSAAVPALVVALASTDDDLRAHAKTAICDLGEEAVQPLLDHLTTDNASDVLEMLESLDPYWHLQTSDNPCFLELVESRELLPQLQAAQTDSQVRVAFDKLAHLGPSHREFAISALRQLLRSPNTDVRLAAAGMLIELERTGLDTVTALAELLGEPEEKTQEEATALLEQIGMPAVPILIEQLAATDRDVQQSVVEVLCQIGAPAVPALIEQLASEDTNVRQATIKVLRQIGEPTALLAMESGGTLKLWDASTGQELLRLTGHI